MKLLQIAALSAFSCAALAAGTTRPLPVDGIYAAAFRDSNFGVIFYECYGVDSDEGARTINIQGDSIGAFPHYAVCKPSLTLSGVETGQFVCITAGEEFSPFGRFSTTSITFEGNTFYGYEAVTNITRRAQDGYGKAVAKLDTKGVCP